MLYKTILPLILSSLLLSACQTTETQVRTSQFSHATEQTIQTVTTERASNLPQDNSALILDYCQMSVQECRCLAEQLSSNLTDEQWLLLRAAIYQEENPNIDVSDIKLERLNQKMIEAAQACSR